MAASREGSGSLPDLQRRFRHVGYAATFAGALVGCGSTAAQVRAYDQHEAGVVSGDYVRCPKRAKRLSHPKPALVYVHFLEGAAGEPNPVKVDVNGSLKDDDVNQVRTWLLRSLKDAGAIPATQSSVEFDSFAMYKGPQFEKFKVDVMARLEEVFQLYGVLFTDQPPQPSIWFDTSNYMTVEVSRRADRVLPQKYAFRSYSPWDPDASYRNEVALVFDYSLSPKETAGRIAHAIGHLLGLEDTVAPGNIMAHDVGGAWANKPIMIRPGKPDYDPTESDWPTPSPRFQNDSEVLASHVGRRTFLPDGTEVGDIFNGFLPAGAGGPARQPPDIDCRYKSQLYDPTVGQWVRSYNCHLFGSDGFEYVWIEHRPVNWTPSGPVEEPPVVMEPGGDWNPSDPPAGPQEPPKDLPPAPPESPRDRTERLGKCQVKKGSEIASAQKGKHQVVFQSGVQLKPGQTNCTDLLQTYVRGVTGRVIPASAEKLFAVALGDPNKDPTLLASGDLKIRGPQGALVALGWADEVDGLAHAQAGDIVQQWVRRGGQWQGHQYVLADIRPDSGAYVMYQYGAHLKGGVHTRLVSVPVNVATDADHRYFVARIKPDATDGCAQ
jgi:hypothetical protein